VGDLLQQVLEGHRQEGLFIRFQNQESRFEDSLPSILNSHVSG
jgi:hypothetical protein